MSGRKRELPDPPQQFEAARDQAAIERWDREGDRWRSHSILVLDENVDEVFRCLDRVESRLTALETEAPRPMVTWKEILAVVIPTVLAVVYKMSGG